MQPAATLLLREETSWTSGKPPAYATDTTDDGFLNLGTPNMLSTRHGSGRGFSEMVFLDGPVRALRLPEAALSPTSPQANAAQYNPQTGDGSIAPDECFAPGKGTAPAHPDASHLPADPEGALDNRRGLSYTPR